jgi:hypothetical protein
MPVVELTASEWLVIITHVKKWVTNLLRAKANRRRESKDALRAVIKAVRKTTLYIRNIHEGGKKSIEKEGELSLLWTELSFRLEDLGLRKLARRCDIKGSYWADPTSFDKDSLFRADIRLSEIEEIANSSLKELKK